MIWSHSARIASHKLLSPSSFSFSSVIAVNTSCTNHYFYPPTPRYQVKLYSQTLILIGSRLVWSQYSWCDTGTEQNSKQLGRILMKKILSKHIWRWELFDKHVISKLNYLWIHKAWSIFVDLHTNGMRQCGIVCPRPSTNILQQFSI